MTIIHHYLYRLADRCLGPLLVAWLHRKGLQASPRVSFTGLPIITLAPSSRIVIGPGCRLISRAENTPLGVNHGIVLRTLNRGAEIRLGQGVRASGLTICAAKKVTIGDRCVIGANATIVDTDFHSLDPAIRSSAQDAVFADCCPVEIGSDVFIGAGTYILKGVTVGMEAIIGAGSVVTQNVPCGTIVAGNPATVRGVLRTQERDQALLPIS
jgi:serine acetyltransferase